MQKNKVLLLAILLLVGTILFFAFIPFDLYVQDFFYDRVNDQWLLNRDEPILKFIFYDGIKKLLIIFSLSIAIALIFFRKKSIIIEYKKGLIIVLLAAILVPLSVGSLKAVTNMPCPKNMHYYHGNYPRINIFESYTFAFEESCHHCKIKCWPAGHASGGFALMALFFLFKTPRNKNIALVVALIIGFSMGTYKMLIGDHFLSHTLITMLIAWVIILLLDKLINKPQRREFEKPTQV